MSILVARKSSVDLSGLQDWATRIAQPGVLTYTRFDSSSDVTNGTLIDGLESRLSWQSSIKTSGTGALRFDIPNSDGSNSGNWWFYLKPAGASVINGDTIYVTYRYYSPEAMWRNMPSPGAGYKVSIISNHDSSSVPNEMVIQNTLYKGYLQAYHQDGSSFPPFEEARSTPCNSGNFALQNAIDTGSPSSPSTCAQYAARYGPLYDYGDANGSPSTGDVLAQGHPRVEALSSGFPMPSAAWISIKIKVSYGHFGSSDSSVRVWAARDGDPYTLIHSYDNVLFGNDPSHPVNVLWLLPYETSRISNTKGVDTFVCYDEVIVSTQDIAAPVHS